MPRLAAITTPGGLVILSIRHGPGAAARRVFTADPDRTIAVAAGLGLDLVRHHESASIQPLNRAAGVRWTWLALRRGAELS